MADKLIVGSLELCDLPDIGISDLQVRVDTGARTSSLHVDHPETFNLNGKHWVRFDIHPNIHNVDNIIKCESPLYAERTVKSSNGLSEKRYVIQTTLRLGGESWLIKLNLTDRSDMRNLMLLGREGMKRHILVDPSRTFLLGKEGEN